MLIKAASRRRNIDPRRPFRTEPVLLSNRLEQADATPSLFSAPAD